MNCRLCGESADSHACAVAPTLADHLTAAEFYGTCPGDMITQAYLYPESFYLIDIPSE